MTTSAHRRGEHLVLSPAGITIAAAEDILKNQPAEKKVIISFSKHGVFVGGSVKLANRAEKSSEVRQSITKAILKRGNSYKVSRSGENTVVTDIEPYSEPDTRIVYTPNEMASLGASDFVLTKTPNGILFSPSGITEGREDDAQPISLPDLHRLSHRDSVRSFALEKTQSGTIILSPCTDRLHEENAELLCKGLNGVLISFSEEGFVLSPAGPLDFSQLVEQPVMKITLTGHEGTTIITPAGEVVV